MVELYVNRELQSADLQPGGPDSARRAELEQGLAALTGEDEILRLDIRTPDGSLIASSAATAERDVPLDPDMRAALGGVPAASLLDAAPQLAGLESAGHGVVQEYLPLVSASGDPAALVAIWRDAEPIMSRVDLARRDIAIVTLAAALLLALLLFLLFRGAQRRLSRQQAQLLEAEHRDPLTELLNHGALVAELTERLERSRARDTSVAIALLDIDNFRLLNETHGHEAGDLVLLRVAGHLQEHLAADDVLGRYGPDEFLLVRVGTDQDEMASDLERICAGLRSVSVRFGESDDLPVTASAGIAVSPRHAVAVTELLSAAAVAVGEAKSGGGDAVRIAPSGPERRLFNGSFDVLSGLVIAVDTKDRYTKRHSEDVARYAVFLARRIGLDDETLETIRLAGLLHDVGKIGIPDELLRKPGRLEAGEYDVFKQHVALGDAIVRDLPHVERIREGIRFHHERWDGRGYLEGLEGGDIPIVGRILAVADAFSAMTTTRPYRKALPVVEALKRLGDAADSQLEEGLVIAFIDGIETAADAPLPGDERPNLWQPLRRVA
jgi:diguanylate cyclase (GGDEF)-like protein/putative nucleotidyltransferase with HDIG domain